MTAAEKLEDLGYEDVVVFENFSYDDALIGVSEDNRAVYDYDLMIDWICREQGWSTDDAIEWIEYNTVRALPYAGESAPIVVRRFPTTEKEKNR